MAALRDLADSEVLNANVGYFLPVVENATHVERLLTINRRLESLCSGSDHEGIRRSVLEVTSDLRHVDHARHVRVSNHALRVVQRVSHRLQLTFDTLVFPDLLEWVVRVEHGRGSCLTLLLLWRGFLGRLFFRLLGDWGGRGFSRPQRQVVRLDVLKYVTFLDVALGARRRNLRWQDRVGAQPPTSCWGNLEFGRLRSQVGIETSCRTAAETSERRACHLHLSHLVCREEQFIEVCRWLMAEIDASLEHLFGMLKNN